MAQKSNYIINVTEKGAKKAEKNINGLNSSLGGLAKKAGIAAAGFFGARMLLDGFKQAIDLSAKQELAERKLEGALGKTSQALLNQASALQEVTKFGDEAIIEQQAFLASIGMTEDQIKSILPVAADLASATGMTLESAVRNTAKTFSGLAGELGELVPQVRELTAEQMKSGEAVKVMGALFKGAATTEVNTMSGAMEQMNNAIGDAAENLGDLLGPTIITIAKGFKGAAEAVGGFLESLKDIPTEEALASVSMEKINKVMEDRKKELSALTSQAEAAAVGMGGLTKSEKNRMIVLESQIQKLQERKDKLAEMTESERFAFAAKEQQEARTIELRENAMQAEDLQFTNRQVRLDTDLQKVKKVENAKLSMALATNKALLDSDAELARQKVINQAQGARSAREAMFSVVRSEIMEGTAGYIASLLKTVPAPLSLLLAAGAGGLVNETITSALNQIPNPTLKSFATGGSFVTGGDQLIRVGDNPSGRELVNVTPLDAAGEPTGSGGGMITVNISGNVMSENYTEDVIVPHIKEALRRGEDIGLG